MLLLLRVLSFTLFTSSFPLGRLGWAYIMKNIAVIGAGTMGNGIAHTFAQSGFKVNLIDISEASLERGLATISKNLDRMVAKEKITENDKAETLGNITTYTNTVDGVKNTDLVVEAATENVDLKLKIFKQLSDICDHNVILATNTSSISITQIAAQVVHPERVIGMHFMNPVPIMKLVEIIRGYRFVYLYLHFFIIIHNHFSLLRLGRV